jgi:hypothetical protein
MEHAAMKGHMHIIKWAHENCCPYNVENPSECAASGGSMEVLLWIKAKNTSAWTSAALNAAAANGHLDTAKASFIDKLQIYVSITTFCNNNSDSVSRLLYVASLSFAVHMLVAVLQ